MSLIKTYLQDIRAAHPSNLDKDENRYTVNGLLNAVLEMTNSQASIVSPDVKTKAKESEGRNLDIPVMKKGNVTIKNARSCDVSAGQSESDLVRVVWKTMVADVVMVPGQYAKNQVAYNYDLSKKLAEIAEKFKITIEEDLETALEAAKTQVYNSSIVGDKYPNVGNAIRVTDDQRELFFNDLQAINFADDFYNPTIKVLTNHAVMPTVSHYINQGSGNSTNTNYQFAGKDFRFSNQIDNGVGVKATGYFMPDGSVGLITRTDIDARMNHKTGDGTEWAEDTIPGVPFPLGIKYHDTCSDQSALEANGLEHLTATKVEHWQISVDYAILTPYNSDETTKAGAIRKFEFVPNA